MTTPASPGTAATTTTTQPAAAAQGSTPAATTAQQPAQAAAAQGAATPSVPETPPAAVPAAMPAPSAEKLKLLRERDALNAQTAALEKEKQRVAEFNEAAKSRDAMRILQAAGFTSDEVARFLIGAQAAPGATSTPAEKSETEKQLEEALRSIEALKQANDARTQSEKQAEEQAARTEALHAISESKELPWVNALGMGDAVLARMQAEFQKSGTFPELEATAKAVETELVAQMPAYFERLLQIPQVRSVFDAALAKVSGTPATPPVAGASAPAAALVAPEPPRAVFHPVGRRTLSNDLNASGGAPQRPRSPTEAWREVQRKYQAGGT